MSKIDSSLIDVIVTSREVETDQIINVTLAEKSGALLPEFEAGAHVDVHLENGLIRQYSLCNNPNDTSFYQLGILLDDNSRGGSIAAHKHLHIGESVKISQPRNNFPLNTSATKSILFAGGIGITPMMAMAHELHQQGVDFELHYCTRSADKTAFRNHINESPYSANTTIYHDDGNSEETFDIDSVLSTYADDTHLYICGPSGYIDFVAGKANAKGWGDSNTHVERFGAVALDGETSFTVIAQKSGQEIIVGSEETIVEALENAGVFIEVSCQQGVCGSCMTDVVEGEPDHHDMYLSEEEQASNKLIMPCCSRSKTPTITLAV